MNEKPMSRIIPCWIQIILFSGSITTDNSARSPTSPISNRVSMANSDYKLCEQHLRHRPFHPGQLLPVQCWGSTNWRSSSSCVTDGTARARTEALFSALHWKGSSKSFSMWMERTLMPHSHLNIPDVVTVNRKALSRPLCS